MIDRVYVREKINEVLSKYQYLIKSIEVKVPANVLHGGRKEIVILSGKPRLQTHSHHINFPTRHDRAWTYQKLAYRPEH